jgi:hypothetical protein
VEACPGLLDRLPACTSEASRNAGFCIHLQSVGLPTPAALAAPVRPPVPPFNEETARHKVKAAEDAWNTCDSAKVSLAYTEDSEWRNRAEFFNGREAIKDFLRRKWAKELDYRLRKEL